MAESIHDKLERVRKPHVHIKYEVQTGGAPEVKELPFVVGVMGDFSGDPVEPLKPLGERKFTQISRDNFDDVMRRMKPRVVLDVPNTLAGDGSTIKVVLEFESMKDFEPGQIVAKVEPLRRLLEARTKLRQLANTVDVSKPELEKFLEQLLKNPDQLQQVAGQLGIAAPQKEGDQ